MMNLTNLIELIEYSDSHRMVFSNLSSIGVDINLLTNPDIDVDHVILLSVLLRYNIEPDPKHLYNLNDYINHGYYRNGFSTYDTFAWTFSGDSIPYQEPALVDYLGIKDTDFKDYDMFRTLSIRLGKTITRDDYYQDLLRYRLKIMEYFKDDNDMYYKYNQMRAYYTFATGKEHLLTRNRYTTNQIISALIYYDCPDIDKICQTGNSSEQEQYSYLQNVETEFNLTGRVSIMLDDDYPIVNRIFLLDMYKSTGIDLRYVERIKKNAIR